MSNIVTYINMLGAVVAIYLGYETISKERNQGTLKLLITRPIYKDQVISGKILGGLLVILILLTVILLFNIILFTEITGLMLSSGETVKLFVYFILAFSYLFFFFTLSLFVSIKVKESEYGFLLLMIIWMVISYVIPALADSQRNFSYFINSTTQTLSQVPTDSVLSKIIELFSPAVQLAQLGDNLLQVNASLANETAYTILANNIVGILMVIIPGIVFSALSYLSIQKEKNL